MGGGGVEEGRGLGDVSLDPQYGLGRQFLPNFQFPIYRYIYIIL